MNGKKHMGASDSYPVALEAANAANSFAYFQSPLAEYMLLWG
jgi:hypothetical protein